MHVGRKLLTHIERCQLCKARIDTTRGHIWAYGRGVNDALKIKPAKPKDNECCESEKIEEKEVN